MAVAQNRQSMLQGQWQMRRCDQDIWHAAAVPGSVHTDLMRHALVADPFVGLNEREAQWVDKHDWQYRLRFDLAADIPLDQHIEMVFPGLDTYAEVTLNGATILEADNMFRTWRVPVAALLRQRDNLLDIVFRSPIRIGEAKLDSYGISLPAVNDQSELGGVCDKKLSVFSRKSGYHFGWDWGPRLVTSGIFRSIYLESFKVACIRSIRIVTEKIVPGQAQIAAEIEIDADRPIDVDLSWEEPSAPFALQKRVALKRGKNVVPWKTTLKNPRLWWCHTHGTPHLYDFQFTLSHQGERLECEKVTTGIRTIELVRERDERGNSFFFRLNGKPIFAKGANYIPHDSFVTRVTAEKYQRSIELCVEAHMNMLRVWGGGFFEEDGFYALCDRHGILIWHDFMFACSLYPDGDDFMANVRGEIVDNVTRLRNHPSIALWCGNNEIDCAWGDELTGGGWGWRERFDAATQRRLWRGYKRLFHDMIPEILGEIDETRPYWPSSPSADIDVRANINAGSGDIHYWGVWHQNHPFKAFKDNVGRFMSEYGFQSLPDPLTVASFAAPSQQSLEAEVIAARQRCPGGTTKIIDYMKSELGTARDFAAFVPLSQLLHAMGLKTAIEAHRRAMPYCMGTLYWQLNDCWPTMSWASLDYDLRPKAAHWAAKRAFAPTILSLTWDNTDAIGVHVVTDVAVGGDASLRLQLIDVAGEELWRFRGEVVIAPAASSEVWRGSLSHMAGDHQHERLVLLAGLERGGASLARSSIIFVKPPALARPGGAPEVRLLTTEHECALEVTSPVYHYAVWLTAGGFDGIFSDNYFELLPHEVHRVALRTRDGRPVTSPPAQVTAHALLDMLQD